MLRFMAIGSGFSKASDSRRLNSLGWSQKCKIYHPCFFFAHCIDKYSLKCWTMVFLNAVHDSLVLQQNFIFYSPNELEIKLSSVGISCECLALEKGFFKAFLSIKSNGFVSQVRLRFNKKVIITGDRPSDKIRFSYCHLTGFSENDYPLVFGQIIQPHSIAGFGSLDETSCIFPAGATSIHYAFDAQSLQVFAERNGFDSFLELRQKTNQVHFGKTKCDLIRRSLNGILNSDELVAFNINDLLLNVTPIEKVRPTKIRTRYKVAHDFLRWSHNNVIGKPPCLDDIAKELFVSRRSLIQSVQEYFQCGPAELHKSIRLQHCNHLLASMNFSDAETASVGLNSVNDIMRIYGFKHRGAFAQSFKNQFGHTPSSVLSAKGRLLNV